MDSQVSGEITGSGAEFDDLPMGSVVYVGRGSFRMEAVALDGERQDEPGTPRPVVGMVTAQLHAPAVSLDGPARASDSAHGVRALFSSQLSVPLLAAPTGSASFQAPPLTISRAALATVGAVVLLCGIVVGTAARHLFASPAPLALAPAPAFASAPVAAPVAPPVVVPTLPSVQTAPPVPPPVVAVPAPLTIRAHTQPGKPAATPVRKAAAPSVDANTKDAAPPKDVPAKAWVDPWAN